jgi:hypothetical protein
MAEKKEKDPCRLTIKNVRLSYPNIFAARAFGRGDGKPAYSAAAIIDEKSERGQSAIRRILAAADAALEKKWPGKDVKIKAANKPFFRGDESEEIDEHPEQEGKFIIRARNYKKPMVVDENGDDLIASDNKIYGGCYVDMILTLWAQDYEGTKRLNCSLEGVRFKADGEPFGAGPIDPSEFDDDDEDEDDRPAKKPAVKKASRDEDEEDERPAKKKASRDDDEDEDGRPRRKAAPKDEEDEDDRPARRRASRDDDEDDDRPARRRSSRDDIA